MELAKKMLAEAQAEQRAAAAKVRAAKAAIASLERAAAEEPARKRLFGTEEGNNNLELGDFAAGSLAAKRLKAKASEHVWAVGDRIQAKFLASSKGSMNSCGWCDGKITAMHDIGERGYAYDILYDDGDAEKGVFSKFVKARTSAPPKPVRAKQKTHSPAAVEKKAAAEEAARKRAAAEETARLEAARAEAARSEAARAEAARVEAARAEAERSEAARRAEAEHVATVSRAEANSEANSDFLYAKPWHKSVKDCQQHGCKLRHITLQDFVPNANRSDRQKLRNKAGRSEILGLQSDGAQDAGSTTMRARWWWHEGDPQLSIAKSVFGK
jgi:hypothetical protein